MDTISEIREAVNTLMTRVHKLEIDTALLLRGHEEHMTRMGDFIRRFERNTDDTVRRNEKIEEEDKEYKREMRQQVTKLVANSHQLEGMKTLIKIQWIGVGGIIATVAAAAALISALHH